MPQFGNPWIFRDIIDDTKHSVSTEEILETIIKHFDLLEIEKGEYVATREMRKHISYYVKGMSNATEIRRTVNKLESKQEVEDFLKNSIK